MFHWILNFSNDKIIFRESRHDETIYLLRLFVCVEALRPSQQFFSHIGAKPMLPGFIQHCRELVGIEQPGFGVRWSTTTPPRVCMTVIF